MSIWQISLFSIALAYVVARIFLTDWAHHRFGIVKTSIAQMLFVGVTAGAFYFTA